MDDQEVKELVKRVRGGDQAAATLLWEEYKEEIERAVSMRLSEKLRRVCDTSDVCQSIFRQLLEGLRGPSGREIHGRAHLFRLFVQMADHKIIDHARKLRKTSAASADEAFANLKSSEKAPDQTVSDKDYFERVRGELTESERTLVDLRVGMSLEWEEIAARLKVSEEALRVRWSRLLKRLRQTRGPEEE